MKQTTRSIALILSLTAAVTSAAEDKPATPAPASASKVSAAWAYTPPAAIDAPAVKQKAWVRTPIDAFVLAKLEDAKLKPSRDTDRATYIRRATLDTVGLLPTPEEVQAFQADKSPNAYEKLVDRLLASQHFGERQARRWLDLARYADSAGFQNDQTRPNNFRYRDYVINAFNSDKPFDRFIKEQIAGDELYPDNQEAKIATGFLAGYPDNYNSRDLVQRKYQIETDMTDLVGETFLASTIGCARCHNHKADKVSQKEYFQLQAFFANTAFEHNVKVAEGPSEVEFKKKQEAYRAATKDIRDRQKAILDQFREKGDTYYRQRYLTDSREAVFKPEKDWTPLDRWVNFRYKFVSGDPNIVAYLRMTVEEKASAEYNPANEALWKEYQKLTKDLAKFDNLRPEKGSLNYSTATELGKEAPPTFVRFGGVHEKPLEQVQPGIPALWAGKNLKLDIKPLDKSSGRRTALASWLASPENPLTARVFVNRVWSQYFDKGIVATVADFGRAGDKPTHPELLDYLATDFVKNGWSVKRLHKQILLSSVCRQASDERQDVVKVDPANKLLAIYPRKRLEAEQIRDSLLAASGKLEDSLGGPAVFPPIPASLNAGALWTTSKDVHDHNRRSVYTFVRRSVAYPLTQTFDPADPSAPHHKRAVTTTALQALTLFNSDIVFGWSQALAGRVIREAPNNDDKRLDRLYEVLFAREPSKQERTLLKDFLAKQEQVIASRNADGKFAVAVPTGTPADKKINPIHAAAFVDLVHTVANSNDFAYRF